MAACIVEKLEVIEVAQHQREGRSIAPRGNNFAVKQAVKTAAVHQAREGVYLHHFVEPLVGCIQLGRP